jgi:hypothetical protein
MSTIHLKQTTTATPEQFVAGLTDFGPGRSKLFGNSADDYLKVHDQGPSQADVTEPGTPARERRESRSDRHIPNAKRGGNTRLVGAYDLEILVHEDVVGPVDADVVDLVLAVAQLDDTVDDAAWVGGQCGFGRLVRCRSADDRPRPLTVVRRDLTDLF